MAIRKFEPDKALMKSLNTKSNFGLKVPTVNRKNPRFLAGTLANTFKSMDNFKEIRKIPLNDRGYKKTYLFCKWK